MELSRSVRGKFKEKRILVIGDIVADQFLSGTISRISREAPVFILRHDETDTFPGGAANAAANVAALGGTPVLIGVIGNDDEGRQVSSALSGVNADSQFLLFSDRVRTTAKVRVLGGQQYGAKKQVLRIDYENRKEIPGDIVAALIDNLRMAARDAVAIVISDYGYGVCTAEVFEVALEVAEENKIPVLVDSRFRLNEFGGARSATPNKEEAEALLDRAFDHADAETLRESLGFDSLLVTLGGDGMAIAVEGMPVEHIAAVGSDQPLDVTGAGDTVIAAYALGLASDFSPYEAARIANHAGGIVVMKRGTAVASIAELEVSLEKDSQTATSASPNEG